MAAYFLAVCVQCKALAVSFQIQAISFFFLSPYFSAPFTDSWANSSEYVNILFLASA